MSKGIRRFGFIASVLWLTVGTVWMHKSVMDQRAGNAVFALHLSQEVVTRPPPNPNFGRDLKLCDVKFSERFMRDVGTDSSVWAEAAINVALVLALGWLALWIVSWLGRWVGAGSKQSA
jgi:hypothetical protein